MIVKGRKENMAAAGDNKAWVFCRLSEEEYREFREKNYPNSDFLNTVEAMNLKESNGWRVEYFGVKDDGDIIAATPICSIPVMKVYRYYYASRGFLMDMDNRELLTFLTKNLKDTLAKQKGLYMVVDPYIFLVERDENGNIVEGGYDNSRYIDNFCSLGYEYYGSPTDYSTAAYVNWQFVLDLEGKSKDELWKAFDQSNRTYINKTKNQGIEIRELAEDEYHIFTDMENRTAERRGFAARESDFYKKLKAAYGDKMSVLLAYIDLDQYDAKLKEEVDSLEKELESINQVLQENPESKKSLGRQKEADKQLVACKKRLNESKELRERYGRVLNISSSIFLNFDVEVIYLFSANEGDLRQFAAPYAIQWYTIQKALDEGKKRYNFYGISGNFSKDADDYGVFEYKRAFRGRVEQYIGDFILPLRGMYKVYRFLKRK